MSTAATHSREITRAAERSLEQYGDPLVMNTYLKVTILVLAAVCLALAGLLFRSQKALANLHPMIVRINDVGRAEAIRCAQQEKSCRGEHDINKEACSAKRGRSGPDVWIFRWREAGPDGNSKQRKALVGTVIALSTEAAALKAAKALRIDANQQTPQAGGGPSTIAELVAQYRLKELVGEDQGRKSFSTRAAYECYLKNWILPRWGTHRLDQVKPVAVEEWLGGVKRAKATKAKIRNLMSALFHHAMRYEWVDRNPIELVRQSAKRERAPDVLELAEIQLLLSRLSLRERTLVLLDAATGLRASELLALRWEDVDFGSLELRVTRSIWHQVVGNCKTEASAKPVPLDDYLGRGSSELAPAKRLPDGRRLGICKPEDERGTALLAGQHHEAPHSAGCQ